VIKKLLYKSGINRENTRYYTESGYYDGDKIRFRQGTPQVIGGWEQISSNRFLGICRSLWSWATLSGSDYIGIGTNEKFYVSRGGLYYDITPIGDALILTNPFTASVGSSVITVTEATHKFADGDYVTFYGATGLGGAITASVLNQEYRITYVDTTHYTIDTGVTATVSDTGHGGTVRVLYQIPAGAAINVPLVGWGAGYWGYGYWGIGGTSTQTLRLWSQSNFGQDLIFGPRGAGIYYWSSTFDVTPPTFTVTIASPAVATSGIAVYEGQPIQILSTGALPTGLSIGATYYARNVSGGTTFNLSATATGALINTSGSQSGTNTISIRAINLNALPGASDAPTIQNYLFVSDASRFVFALGCNDYGSTTQDPMLIRWSDQEDATMWTPSATNQAGSIRVTGGSEIVTAIQTRQEIIVFTDAALYSLQYLGPPYVWGTQLMGDNISIASQNAVSQAANVVYWMGVDKFYKYDGRAQTLRCDLKEFIFNDINRSEFDQVFSGTNEGFNEVWWFYCTANSTTIDRYVVYNYLEDIWYYGSMARTAWLDSGLYPTAATYTKNLVNHEYGLNDNETGTELPINAFITTSESDMEDGHNFVFIRRILPDITFRGSTAESPSATMSVIPLNNSGSGYTDPTSVGGSDNGLVTRTATVPIEQFTGQLFVRVRGRQFVFKIESNQLDTTWQMGAIRLDIMQDGRRST
jgi:hypothetical protein